MPQTLASYEHINKSGGPGSDLSTGRHGRLQGIGKGLNMGRDFGQYLVVEDPQKCRSPELPQMENRDLGWIGLGLGNPKTLFSAKNTVFWAIFGHFPLFGEFPWGGLHGIFYLSGPCK